MSVRRALALVAWALLVLACSAGVWAVIAAAGTDVTTSPQIPSATTSAASAPRGAANSSPPTSRPRTTSPPPSSGPAPAPSGTPSTDRPRAGEPDHPARSSQGPTEVRRTWQGPAGAVVASCRGRGITFGGAQPNSGWRIEVGDRGPEQIEVKFTRSGDDETSGEVELKARCVGGQPQFSTHDD